MGNTFVTAGHPDRRTGKHLDAQRQIYIPPSLAGDNNHNSEEQHSNISYDTFDYDANNSILNCEISIYEIESAIKKLKNGKACGDDNYRLLVGTICTSSGAEYYCATSDLISQKA